MIIALLLSVAEPQCFIKGCSMKFISKVACIATLFLFSSANAAFINFNDYTTSEYGNQFKAGTATVENGGTTLTLAGNLWVDILASTNLTSTSILNFSFEATGLNAELYGIAFDNNDSYVYEEMSDFAFVGGTQAPDIDSANAFFNYESGDGVVNFSIDIGQYITGSFNRIVFILDNDENWSGSVASFTNVEICDNILVCQTSSVTQVAEPSHIGFAGLAIMLVGALRRKIKR